jgi:hypothetical protein
MFKCFLLVRYLWFAPFPKPHCCHDKYLSDFNAAYMTLSRTVSSRFALFAPSKSYKRSIGGCRIDNQNSWRWQSRRRTFRESQRSWQRRTKIESCYELPLQIQTPKSFRYIAVHTSWDISLEDLSANLKHLHLWRIWFKHLTSEREAAAVVDCIVG